MQQLLLVLLLATCLDGAQASGVWSPDTLRNGKIEINVSAAISGPINGSKNYLENATVRSGFADQFYGFFGWTSYPISSNNVVSEFEIIVFFRPTRGVLLTIGKIEELEIKGFDYKEPEPDDEFSFYPGARTHLYSDMHQFSLGYTWRSPSKRGQVTLGAALITHKLRFATDESNTTAEQKVFKPGLFGSAQYHLVNRPWGFLGFKFSGRLAPNSKFDAFSVSHEGRELTYESSKVPTVLFNLGLTAGFRFRVAGR